VIDLRSDTVTLPTPEMRRAIADAALGDEQKREDPTVLELERRTAELLGQEAAVFVPTATMANQIALKLHGRPGDVLLAHETSHVLVYEYGGAAAHAGLMSVGLPGSAGRVTAEQIRVASAPSTKVADQRVAVLSLENTHNNSGGRVWPLGLLGEVVTTARELGIAVHLDGARLLNASVALGVDPAEIAARFDTVTLCLSKGLGCPLGALLAGSDELIERAWREKHLFGGAMRQAGIVAAAGVYALDHHVDRLAEDHARARVLGERLQAAGLAVDVDQIETNFVQVDVAPLGLARAEALAHLRDADVGLSATIHATVLRAVTHLGITDDDVDRASELIPRALGVVAVPAGSKRVL
jgi:threonine aldolase